MTDKNQIILDAFADARRTWDEMVGLQPDVYAFSGNFQARDLAELTRRVAAHQAAMDVLLDAIQTEPARQPEELDRS